jgi:translation initiation factor 4G
MDAYCLRMQRYTEAAGLDSRLRFMIMDVLDMRRAGWAARRKQEGPKKIDDIHKVREGEGGGVSPGWVTAVTARGDDMALGVTLCGGCGGRWGHGCMSIMHSPEATHEAHPLRPANRSVYYS